MDQQTFIIDCPFCKAKVAAFERGSGTYTYWDEEIGEPIGTKLIIGSCPNCRELLVGRAYQTEFEGFQGAERDEWSKRIDRVYPTPQNTFRSHRIPESALESLSEADRSLQAGANIAACAMFGRALEALCRDVLGTRIMLGQGVSMLKDKGFIDERIYDWSQQLRAFRNLAAHPDAITVSMEDAEDLQSFVYAIFEYIYDLTDRYEEFKARMAKKPASK
jgi:hypothetical protein